VTEARSGGILVSSTLAVWQGALAVQKLLARYLRAVADPDAPE
jgi:hypothetical protein